jgi:hypothetical protein
VLLPEGFCDQKSSERENSPAAKARAPTNDGKNGLVPIVCKRRSGETPLSPNYLAVDFKPEGTYQRLKMKCRPIGLEVAGLPGILSAEVDDQREWVFRTRTSEAQRCRAMKAICSTVRSESRVLDPSAINYVALIGDRAAVI